MKLISTTPNGQIFTCPCKRKVHLEFGNLLVNETFISELEKADLNGKMVAIFGFGIISLIPCI